MAKTEGQIKRKRKSAGHTTTSRASAAKSKELSILFQNYLKWKSNFEKFVAPSTSRSISPTTNDMNLKGVIAGRSTTHRKEISLLHISKPWDGCKTVKQEYIEQKDSDDLQHFNEKSDSDESERPDEENDSHSSEDLSTEGRDLDEAEQSFAVSDTVNSHQSTEESESPDFEQAIEENESHNTEQSFIEINDPADSQESSIKESGSVEEENDSHNSEELSIEESDPDEPKESFEEIDSDDSEHYTTASESGEYSVDCFNASTFGDTSYDLEDAHYVTADNFEYIKSHDSNSSDASEESTDPSQSKPNLSTPPEITVRGDLSASRINLSTEDQLSSDSEDDTSTDLEDNWVNISSDRQLFHLTDNFYDCDMVLKICLLDKPLYEKDVETLLQKYTGKPSDKSSEEHSEEFTENTSEKPLAMTAENFAESTSENPLDKSSEKSLDKPSVKFTEKTSERPSDKSFEKSSDKPSAKITENAPEKTSAKSAEQPSQNYSEKPSETLSEKPSEKLAETPSEEDSDLNESFTGLENLYKKSVKHLYFL
ncbi:protein starmaker-like [Ceratitis capitata]|uniref:protein starmaker-like n=1 Tax=Ceratitis capitata TaxID=7213 RepID=UPI000C6C5742|nr:protein starmaker-like [Ceratitis capitata]